MYDSGLEANTEREQHKNSDEQDFAGVAVKEAAKLEQMILEFSSKPKCCSLPLSLALEHWF